ncbi:MAG: UDP-2,4-diacetamido-2,4,6-trideoxy-beta-L-altropyranose hydrolase [Desulfovibrionales bacterium]|nr:UDP-2,4-diacetamido-2,4,6-trideoxy-beta-L-altropyranose hydrolase [Desulfovibrionales bacterium]
MAKEMNSVCSVPSVAKNLVIRADAGTEIGAGHVMRCLALAQGWQDAGGHPIFAMATEAPNLEVRLKSEGVEVVHLAVKPGSAEDATATASLAQEAGATWITADGYRFDTRYQRMVKGRGARLLIMDDYGHASHYYADIVLNQNIYASEEIYRNREPYTKLLLGTCYALLRREFMKWHNWKREIPDMARKILATLGGSDPDNISLKVIDSIKMLSHSDLEVKIIAGPSNMHVSSLKQTIYERSVNGQRSTVNISLLSAPHNMPELMAWADLAISAAGTTCWELAFMRLPALLLVVADNQNCVADRLEAAGAAINLGRQSAVPPHEISRALLRLLRDRGEREAMARSGRNLVDGEGAARVVKCLQGGEMELRPASVDDCRLLWKWANDPETREVSFSPESIKWEDHVKWLESKLGDPGCVFWVASNGEGTSIGQVRFDVDGGEAIISVSVDKAFRNRGYGNRIIRLACGKVFETARIGSIHAYVKEGNYGSAKAFFNAGFKRSGICVVKGQKAFHFVMERPQ